MHYSYLIPNWFFGFDVGMEILFAIITLLVAIFSFKVYNVTSERRIKLFGAAFVFISLSYVVWAGVNLWIVNEVSEGFREISLISPSPIDFVSLLLHVVLYTIGLVILTYAVSDFKYGKTFYLICGLSFLVLILGEYLLISFRILSVFLLAFITYYYLKNYLENRKASPLIILIAFILLVISNIEFVFSLFYYQSYIFGHILELSAYLLILFNLLRSVKK